MRRAERISLKNIPCSIMLNKKLGMLSETCSLEAPARKVLEKIERIGLLVHGTKQWDELEDAAQELEEVLNG